MLEDSELSQLGEEIKVFDELYAECQICRVVMKYDEAGEHAKLHVLSPEPAQSDNPEVVESPTPAQPNSELRTQPLDPIDCRVVCAPPQSPAFPFVQPVALDVGNNLITSFVQHTNSTSLLSSESSTHHQQTRSPGFYDRYHKTSSSRGYDQSQRYSLGESARSTKRMVSSGGYVIQLQTIMEPSQQQLQTDNQIFQEAREKVTLLKNEMLQLRNYYRTLKLNGNFDIVIFQEIGRRLQHLKSESNYYYGVAKDYLIQNQHSQNRSSTATTDHATPENRGMNYYA